MNIGIATHRFPPAIGGTELYAERLAGELHRRGHRVTVFTTAHPERAATPYEVREFANPMPEHFGYFAWPGIVSPGVLRTIRGLDAIHCINASMFSAVVGALAHRCFGTTAVLTTTYHPPRVQTHRRLKRGYDSVVLQRLLPEYDRLVVSSEFERRQLETTFDLSTCHVSKHFVPPSVVLPARPRVTDGFTVLYVGRLDSHKGILTLLEAFERFSERCPSARCVVVGERERWYEWPAEVTRAIESIEDRLEFTGFVSDQELANWYASSDVLVLPSSYETYGLVLGEALSYGTPVVSTAVGAAPELIDDGENGYCYELGSVTQLTNCLLKIEEADPSALERRAFEAVEGLTWEAFVDELLDIYDS